MTTIFTVSGEVSVPVTWCSPSCPWRHCSPGSSNGRCSCSTFELQPTREVRDPFSNRTPWWRTRIGRWWNQSAWNNQNEMVTITMKPIRFGKVKTCENYLPLAAGTFDWIDDFLETHKGYTEVSESLQQWLIKRNHYMPLSWTGSNSS